MKEPPACYDQEWGIPCVPPPTRVCGKTEPEHHFLMSVCRKWILRRWSDGVMMAAHRTMRLRMTRGAFPLSSFSGR